MRIIKNEAATDKYFKQQQKNFGQRPQMLQLVEFQKGELLNSPLFELNCFYIIVKGRVSIYDLTEDGSIRYIAKAESGTLLGDIEFSKTEKQPFYTEATDDVICLALPFKENRNTLENDPTFLRFVLKQLANKLSLSATMDVAKQTLEERVLFYLKKVQPEHNISSITHALQPLHCSRRQLQRVLKKLCDEGTVEKVGRGFYQLKE